MKNLLSAATLSSDTLFNSFCFRDAFYDCNVMFVWRRGKDNDPANSGLRARPIRDCLTLQSNPNLRDSSKRMKSMYFHNEETNHWYIRRCVVTTWGVTPRSDINILFNTMTK